MIGDDGVDILGDELAHEVGLVDGPDIDAQAQHAHAFDETHAQELEVGRDKVGLATPKAQLGVEFAGLKTNYSQKVQVRAVK